MSSSLSKTQKGSQKRNRGDKPRERPQPESQQEDEPISPEIDQGANDEHDTLSHAMSILIRNLDESVTARDLLMGVFTEGYDIVSAVVHVDKWKRSMGTAEVVFGSQAEAEAAWRQHNGAILHGKQMRMSLMGRSEVNFAQAPEEEEEDEEEEVVNAPPKVTTISGARPPKKSSRASPLPMTSPPNKSPQATPAQQAKKKPLQSPKQALNTKQTKTAKKIEQKPKPNRAAEKKKKSKSGNGRTVTMSTDSNKPEIREHEMDRGTPKVFFDRFSGSGNAPTRKQISTKKRTAEGEIQFSVNLKKSKRDHPKKIIKKSSGGSFKITMNSKQ